MLWTRLTKPFLGVTAALHISWLLTAAAIGITIGGALAPVAGPYVEAHWSWLVFFALGLGVAIIYRHVITLLVMFVSGALLGGWVGLTYWDDFSGYQIYFEETVAVSGTVSNDVVIDESGRQQIRIESVEIDNQELPGEIWTSTQSDVAVKRGDEITMHGRLEDGFGVFAGAMYRGQITALQRPQPGDVGRVARDYFSERVSNSIPEPEAGLGISFLTGQRHELADDVSERLRILGLTHIVVASGFHLTIVVRFARRLFISVSKYLATITSLSMIVAFLLITGFSTSMTRAALVASLSLLAWYYGRNIHPVTLLSIVAAITVLINPAFAWGDMGWLLSFAAFGGVIILAPLLGNFFFGDTPDEQGTVRHLLLATTAAQITTFPIVVVAFGQYSPLALLANLAILPFVPLAMLLTFLSGIGAWVLAPIGDVLGFGAYMVLTYINTVTTQLAQHQWAYTEIEFGAATVVISYLLIAALIVILRIVTGYRLKQANPIR